MDNSLDLISDINKQIKKLFNKTQKGGAIKKLKSFRDNKYEFLSTKEKKLLTQKINNIIGGKDEISKIHYDFFEIDNKKKYNDVGKRGQLSKELENIIGGAEKYKKNPDIEQILTQKPSKNLINTEMINDLIKLKGGSHRSGSKTRPKRKTKNSKQSGAKKKKKGKKGKKKKKGPKVLEALAKLETKSSSSEEPPVAAAVTSQPTPLVIKDVSQAPLPNPSIVLTHQPSVISDLMPAGPLVTTDTVIPKVPSQDATKNCNPSTRIAVLDIFNKIKGVKKEVNQRTFLIAIRKSGDKIGEIRQFFGLPPKVKPH